METRRRILIVVSSYDPAMIADMQRARMLAWELPRLGWDVEILAPESSFQNESYLDIDSKVFFPPDIVVHSARPWIPGIFAKLGMRSIGWRAFKSMRTQGLELLKTKRFDLVYFTTTQFGLFLLGPSWRKRTGIPYVLDFHDPCYQKKRGTIATTKHAFKREIVRKLSKYIESKSVQAASALVSVSPAYLDELKVRYESNSPAWLQKQLYRTIPFGVREEDIEEVRRSLLTKEDRASDVVRVVYVGAGGAIMYRAFALICRGMFLLRQQKKPLVDRARIELYGTTSGWREGDPKDLEILAIEHGVGDLVKEYPGRVSYRRSLELLLEADGALVLGVNDEGYMPSKLFSYALSGRPLLASARNDSPAYASFQTNLELGHALWFGMKNEMPADEVATKMGVFLEECATRKIFNRKKAIQSHLAPAMARQHVELFEACIEKTKASP